MISCRGAASFINRFLRRLAVGASVWAFIALVGTAYALNLALFRPLAFHIDADGRSTFIGRLRENAAPTEPEVRYVAKQFLGHYAAVNSLTIESDLADAWNLMTGELRAEHERQLADYRREHDKDFVAFVKEQGIQMVLEFPSDKILVIDHNARVWTVRLLGAARTWPLNRVGEHIALNTKRALNLRAASCRREPAVFQSAVLASHWFLGVRRRSRRLPTRGRAL